MTRSGMDPGRSPLPIARLRRSPCVASRENDNRDPLPDTTQESVSEAWEADLRLARGALAGQPAATEEFLARMVCIPRILDALARATRPFRSAEDRRDTIQEVFVRVWAALGRFEGRSTLETWIYRFCALTLLDVRRRQDRAPAQFDSEPDRWLIDPRVATLAEQDCLVLQSAVERLLPEESAIVTRKHFDDRTFDEIADSLGVSPNTAKSRYYRAMNSLRRWLWPGFGRGSGPLT